MPYSAADYVEPIQRDLTPEQAAVEAACEQRSIEYAAKRAKARATPVAQEQPHETELKWTRVWQWLMSPEPINDSVVEYERVQYLLERLERRDVEFLLEDDRVTPPQLKAVNTTLIPHPQWLPGSPKGWLYFASEMLSNEQYTALTIWRRKRERLINALKNNQTLPTPVRTFADSWRALWNVTPSQERQLADAELCLTAPLPTSATPSAFIIRNNQHLRSSAFYRIYCCFKDFGKKYRKRFSGPQYLETLPQEALRSLKHEELTLFLDDERLAPPLLQPDVLEKIGCCEESWLQSMSLWNDVAAAQQCREASSLWPEKPVWIPRSVKGWKYPASAWNLLIPDLRQPLVIWRTLRVEMLHELEERQDPRLRKRNDKERRKPLIKQRLNLTNYDAELEGP